MSVKKNISHPPSTILGIALIIAAGVFLWFGKIDYVAALAIAGFAVYSILGWGKRSKKTKVYPPENL